jgi:hypothetical protein
MKPKWTRKVLKTSPVSYSCFIWFTMWDNCYKGRSLAYRFILFRHCREHFSLYTLQCQNIMELVFLISEDGSEIELFIFSLALMYSCWVSIPGRGPTAWGDSSFTSLIFLVAPPKKTPASPPPLPRDKKWTVANNYILEQVTVIRNLLHFKASNCNWN